MLNADELCILVESDRPNERSQIHDFLARRTDSGGIVVRTVISLTPELDLSTVPRNVILVTKAPSSTGWDILVKQLGNRIVWIHSLMAGVDKIAPFMPRLSHNPPLTNAKGAFSDSLAEYCVAAILYFNKQIARLEANKREKKWDKFIMNTVRGKTVGFLGFGSIAQSVAKLCLGFGMSVIGASRSGTPNPSASEMWSTSDTSGMQEFLNSSDYIVCSLPATSETRHFCDANLFASMKASAVFISVGRGDVVDESALAEALRMNRIAGAALDVFETEPLPPSSELWSLDNILISSHNADWIESYFEDSVDIFERNLSRFMKGEKLENLVNVQAGY